MTKEEQKDCVKKQKDMLKKQDKKYIFEMLVKKQKELEKKLWLYDFVCGR
jgi:hypothetical protein